MDETREILHALLGGQREINAQLVSIKEEQREIKEEQREIREEQQKIREELQYQSKWMDRNDQDMEYFKKKVSTHTKVIDHLKEIKSIV